jgi:hypothetical protein
MTDAAAQPQVPQPNPALKKLDMLVGRWELRGRLIGSDEDTIRGSASYEWLPGGFFLRQRVQLDFAGFLDIESEEMIGYDAETGRFKSLVFSNMSPEPLPYAWSLEHGELTISVSYGPLDATFKGRLADDGNSMSGGWRPNAGADETVNVPYDIHGKRISAS